MRALFTAIIITTLSTLVPATPASAEQEVEVESRITSVDLFKNGLAIVRREVTLPGNGTFAITDLPDPIHGTFWVESDGALETRITQRDVEVPASPWSADLQRGLAGRKVRIHSRLEGAAPVFGRVLSDPGGEESQAWSRRYEPSHRPYLGWSGPSSTSSTAESASRFLVLEAEDGQIYVDTSMIAYLHVEGATGTVLQRRPVLLLTAHGIEDGPARVLITYLTKGLAWAPSYRIDLSDPSTLALRQKAVIRNELTDLEGVEIRLISGFPSVAFSHVLSPLSPGTTWAAFFSELDRRVGSSHAALSNVVVQSAVSYGGSSADSGVDSASLGGADGVDLHYAEIGTHDLLEGDALALDTAAGLASYERVVEWVVPDRRDAHGSYVYRGWNEEQDEMDSPWDAIRFRNPLDHAMTTGAAMIVAGDRFEGQRLSRWVASGEETTLRITKALNVRTRSTEQEEPNERETVYVGGRKYRRTKVRSELLVHNHRSHPIQMLIEQQFSGELLEADGAPEVVLRAEGVYSVNERNQLNWTVHLEPGEARTLTYRYSVLVKD